MRMYPFKLEPIFKHRIWGGTKLAEVFGKNLPTGQKIGESWELTDLPDDKSVIANGELTGRTLASAIEQYPKEITGNKNFTGPYPLLIKFLDACDILSVQVHPNGETCKRMGKGEPKTECWYIIDAEPGAVIYKGLKKGVTRQQFSDAIEKGTVAELLNKVPVNPGECHFLPAGTAHSIGAGLLIAEIQTPSDTTYRVFDFNRLDEAGKPRDLHIEEALASINFDQSENDLPVTTIGRLVQSEYFAIDKGHQKKNNEMLISSGKTKTLIFTTGSGTITTAEKIVADFKAGDTILIPAEFEGTIQFIDDTQYLTVTLPENK